MASVGIEQDDELCEALRSFMPVVQCFCGSKGQVCGLRITVGDVLAVRAGAESIVVSRALLFIASDPARTGPRLRI